MDEPAESAVPVSRVLIGCDLSEASRTAAQVGLAIAARLGSQVELVLAWTSSPRLPVTQARPKAHQDLKEFAAQLRWPAGLKVARRTEFGDALHTLLGLGLRGHPDLLVVGRTGLGRTHEGHGRRRDEPGSVVRRLLQSTRVPVLVAPERHELLPAGTALGPEVLWVGETPEQDRQVGPLARAVATALQGQLRVRDGAGDPGVTPAPASAAEILARKPQLVAIGCPPSRLTGGPEVMRPLTEQLLAGSSLPLLVIPSSAP